VNVPILLGDPGADGVGVFGTSRSAWRHNSGRVHSDGGVVLKGAAERMKIGSIGCQDPLRVVSSGSGSMVTLPLTLSVRCGLAGSITKTVARGRALRFLSFWRMPAREVTTVSASTIAQMAVTCG
jgi:hypothetical protein